MTIAVLDASALLVAEALDGALMTTVNLAEVISHYAKRGVSRPDVTSILRFLPITVVPADIGLSYDAGMLRPLTLKGGLSLGDR